MSQPQRHYTLDDYFAALAHNDIASNVLSFLRSMLRDTGCRAFGSDLRVATCGGIYTYPDVSVIWGKPMLVTGRPDTATNPVLLVEVLSEATRDYDRGDKLAACRLIPSLREVLLIDQAAVSIERWQRGDDGAWANDRHDALDDSIALAAVPIALPLPETYREVFPGGA